MRIYGVALLCACYLIGKFMGRVLGLLLGIGGDIGGVGFAMLLLMGSAWYFRKKEWLLPESEKGIVFWSAMYIPIIVAMAASLNVKAAFDGGWVAVLAGGIATLAGFILVPVLSGKREENTQKKLDKE